MTLEEATDVIRNKVDGASPVAAVIAFDFEDDGIISVDGTVTPPVINNARGETDCTVLISLSDFENFLNGSDSPQMAFMMGRLRIEGDMGIALQLSSILG